MLRKYGAIVTKIVDGDTFDADVDLGFYITTRQRFRILGMDAPELRPRNGTQEERANEKIQAKLATNRLYELIGNKTVELWSAKGDSFGRWLCHVFVDGINITETMIREGYAIPYDKK